MTRHQKDGANPMEVDVNDRTCMIDGCDRPSYGRGMCTSHYNRWYRSGSAHPNPRTTVAERLEAKLVHHSSGCIEWTGDKTAGGYGRMSVNGRSQYVHRLVLEATTGPLPRGSVVDHKCRNPICANIDHLQLVTQKQNIENQSRFSRGVSGHRGVTWDARTQKWAVKASHNRQGYWGGRYASLEDAVAAAIELRDRLFTNNLDDYK